MPTVFNIPRNDAQNWSKSTDPNEYAWISIHEPEQQHITNPILDELSNLKIRFWDIVKITQGLELGEYYYPPTKDDAQKILDFLLENRDKNIISNCKVGVSRSAAISKFCHTYFGHEWDEKSWNRARPNTLLYDMLVELYGKPKKTIINDKRRF